MELTAFKPVKSPRRRKRRVGRGNGSGCGGTSGRGHKGQKARSGGKVARGFEGGQMPLARRIPKWGFTNIFKKSYLICNISDLNDFKAGDVVDKAALLEKRMVRKSRDPLKILGDGDLKVKLTVKAHRFSRAAAEKIKAAGGEVEVLQYVNPKEQGRSGSGELAE